MREALNLEQLKALLHKPTQRDYLPCPLVLNGIPRGAISEISGNGKTQFVANLLIENPELKVAWIEDQFSVNPFGLQQRKVKPHRIIYVEAGHQTEWAAIQALRAQVFHIVVLYAEFQNIRTLRRIQLASEKANAATLWLTPQPQVFWTSTVQLKVSKGNKKNELDILTLKRK